LDPGTLADRLFTLQYQHATAAKPTAHKSCGNHAAEELPQEELLHRRWIAFSLLKCFGKLFKAVKTIPWFALDPLFRRIPQIAVTNSSE
jgi:hypothetical protein